VKTKPNLPEGQHDFIIGDVRLMGGKVQIFHNPLWRTECQPVIRTFTQGADSLGSYMEKVTGNRVPYVTEQSKALLRGKMIRALILQSKRPEYMDLVKVITLHPSLPEQPEGFIFNTQKQVSGLETSYLDEEEKGGLDAR
jgi:hypothetical protein